MAAAPERREAVRTIFVSDVHLGCRHAQASAFLKFLRAHRPVFLYLVGDIVDGWKLSRQWRWPPVHHRILHRFLELAGEGCQLIYTPGNHDAFMRRYHNHLDIQSQTIVRMADEVIHQAADGRRYLVTHGDKFDKLEAGSPRMSVITTYLYDALLSVSSTVHRLCRRRVVRTAFSAAVKRRVRRLGMHIKQFEKLLAEAAAARRCDGVICGHIHHPKIAEFGDVIYCNTGDWVEHCTALIEYNTGRLELVHFDETGQQRNIPCAQVLPRTADRPEKRTATPELATAVT